MDGEKPSVFLPSHFDAKATKVSAQDRQCKECRFFGLEYILVSLGLKFTLILQKLASYSSFPFTNYHS